MVALALAAPLAAAAQNPNLQVVLSQMDASAPKFQGVQADIAVDLYTEVVQDHEIQKGTTAFRRVGGQLEMATKIETDKAGNEVEREIPIIDWCEFLRAVAHRHRR